MVGLEDMGAVEGVGMVSLGLAWSEVDAGVVEDGLGKERPALRLVGDGGLGFTLDELPVSEGSIAENSKIQLQCEIFGINQI